MDDAACVAAPLRATPCGAAAAAPHPRVQFRYGGAEVEVLEDDLRGEAVDTKGRFCIDPQASAVNSNSRAFSHWR